jgi:Ni,Fe-hydrogenase III component G
MIKADFPRNGAQATRESADKIAAELPDWIEYEIQSYYNTVQITAINLPNGKRLVLDTHYDHDYINEIIDNVSPNP